MSSVRSLLTPSTGDVETVSCGLCGATTGRMIGTFEGGYRIRRCAECGLMYTAERPVQTATHAHFEDEYITSADDLDTDFGLRRRAALDRVADAVDDRHLGGGTILDLGAAGGELLARFDPARWQRVALEPSRVAVAELASQDLEVVNDFYPTDQLDGRSFDVITMMDLIMLMPDPLAALRSAREQIRQGGTLVVEIPGYAYRNTLHIGPVPLVLKRRWTDLNASIHLFFFSDHTLRAMLTRAGFAVDRVLPLPPSDRTGVLGWMQRAVGRLTERLPGVRSGRPSLAAKYLYVASPVTAA